MNKLVILVILSAFSCSVWADSFRCGRKIVKVGESSNALTKKCGHPARKFSSREIIYVDGLQKRAGVSNWVYERKGKKDMLVAVSGGTVVKMQID